MRGDTAGEYTVRTSYTGTLEPFGRNLLFTASNATPLKVWGTNAVRLVVDVDDEAFRAHPYLVRVGLENITDTDPGNETNVYNPAVELSTEGRLNYIYQPKQQLEFTGDVIRPGETWWTGDYLLIPSSSGLLDLSNSFVKRGAGADENPPADQVISHPPAQTPETAPKLRRTASGGFEWDPVAGAENYQLFEVGAGSGPGGFPTDDFPATPVAETTDTTVDAPGGGRRGNWYAISTVIDGRNVLYHAIIEATGRGRSRIWSPRPSATLGGGFWVGV